MQKSMQTIGLTGQEGGKWHRGENSKSVQGKELGAGQGITVCAGRTYGPGPEIAFD